MISSSIERLLSSKQFIVIIPSDRCYLCGKHALNHMLYYPLDKTLLDGKGIIYPLCHEHSMLVVEYPVFIDILENIIINDFGGKKF